MNHNSRENWDEIWSREGDNTWRTYPKLYNRILELTPPESKVFDVGCGVGKLLDRLKAELNCVTAGCDISSVATSHANVKGHTRVYTLDLTAGPLDDMTFWDANVIVATEVIEHLPMPVLRSLLTRMAKERAARVLLAVPNNCLGPEEEPQHYHKWTAIEFKRLLLEFFDDVRVECIDEGAPRLLAVCNVPKPFQLAFTMPVKNEADDLERTLKSFRGVADHMIIGIDDKTTDASAEIAERYADEVFFFTWENDFSKARNACIERCRPHLAESDWIFMSEGHEHLSAGVTELLSLDVVPAGVHIIEVRREDGDYAWMFPWIFRNRKDIYFDRPVHNTLVWNDETSQVAQMPAVRTWHGRSHKNAIERMEQRRKMNRQELIRQLAENPSDARSCYYLANEWRRENNDRAIHYYERYLSMPGKNGPERYQARLSLAQCLIKRVQEMADRKKAVPNEATALSRQQQADMQAAYNILITACQDDWARNEHWLALGDLCHVQGDRLEQAMRFYELAAVSIGREPLAFMWINKADYSWVPAQKLVTIYAEAGMLAEALKWCDRVAELLPQDAPEEARAEVQSIRQTIISKMEEVRA